jgi:hypothetical protein
MPLIPVTPFNVNLLSPERFHYPQTQLPFLDAVVSAKTKSGIFELLLSALFWG